MEEGADRTHEHRPRLSGKARACRRYPRKLKGRRTVLLNRRIRTIRDKNERRPGASSTRSTVHSPSMAEIQRLADSDGRLGAFAESSNSLLFESEKHRRDDSHGGGSDKTVCLNQKAVPFLGCRVMAHVQEVNGLHRRTQCGHVANTLSNS